MARVDLKKSFNKSEISADSAPIGAWYDLNPQLTSKSSAFQSDNSRKPVYISDALNNLPAIYFEGGKWLTISDNEPNFDIAAPTIFIVASVVSGVSFISKNGGPGNSRRKLGFRPYQFISGNDGVSVTWPSVSLGTLHLYTFSSSSNTSHRFWLDGTLTFSSSDTLYHDEFNDAVLRIGGAWSGALETINAYIGEIIVFDRALSDHEIAEINKYLSKKWGL